jgi:hypothetical protein
VDFRGVKTIEFRCAFPVSFILNTIAKCHNFTALILFYHLDYRKLSLYSDLFLNLNETNNFLEQLTVLKGINETHFKLIKKHCRNLKSFKICGDLNADENLPILKEIIQQNPNLPGIEILCGKQHFIDGKEEFWKYCCTLNYLRYCGIAHILIVKFWLRFVPNKIDLLRFVRYDDINHLTGLPYKHCKIDIINGQKVVQFPIEFLNELVTFLSESNNILTNDQNTVEIVDFGHQFDEISITELLTVLQTQPNINKLILTGFSNLTRHIDELYACCEENKRNIEITINHVQIVSLNEFE